MPSRRKTPILYMVALYKVIKNNNYKMVHIHKSSATMVIEAVICKICRVPIVIGHSHNSLSKEVNLHRILKPVVNKLITHKYACSEEAGRWIFGQRSDFVVIRNAVDAVKYAFKPEIRSDYRRRMNLEGCYVIGIVAKLHKPKNVGRLIDIFREIQKIKDNAVLMIIGDGPEKETLMQKAENIKDKVLFLGMRDDVNNLMSVMDVFVMTSFFEGLPVATIEAQAAGLKLVVSNRVPTVDILGELCVLSLDDNNEIWRDEIIKESLFDRSTAREFVQKAGFDIEMEVKRLEKQYLDAYKC